MQAPSQRTLVAVADRMGPFVRTLGTRGDIFSAMQAGGYSLVHHHEGWRRYMAVCGYTPILPPPTPNDGSPASRAIGILDPLDEQISTRVGAALMFNHPPQAAYVLQNITPSTGAKAVANIKTVLDRITVLERGDREGGEGDLAAMATLEDRGFTPEYRAQLSDLVNQATGADPAPAIVSISPEELEAAQLSLYAWYKEWSMVAHTMIRRRDWLISLGLARRKAASSADEPSDDLDDETVPVVP